MRRTMLFMPGSKPGNLLNGDVYGADSIIIDLEDAVALAEKDSARILTKHAMRTFHYDCELIVRINSLSTPFWQDDLDMIIPEKPDVIMPTKVYTAEDIRTIDAYITKIEEAHGMPVGGVKLIPLLETAASIENAYEIAKASPRMAGLYLGAADLSLDMKGTRTREGYDIAYARSRLVIAARTAGIDALGENRVQEMTAKLAEDAYRGAPLHFIGHLQRNKVKQVVGKAALIQSIGSPELLAEVDRQAEKLGIVQDILLEVNIGGEEAKSGFAPDAVEQAAAQAKTLAHVRVRGLMTIPPADATREENMAYFEKVRALYVDISRKMYDNGLEYLSMGMSGDFADAIRAGANMVRVGSAIFGARDYSK